MSNKAVFLDRDDTLIDDPGYISDPDQVKLLDGVAEALIELRKMGYKLIVVSNQSAVARGIVTEKVLSKIHERLEKLLAQEGAKLDKIYYCPYHPDGVIEKYRKESGHRKPGSGMIVSAAQDMDIDLANSWVVGDSDRDIQAGRNANCTTILLENTTHSRDPQGALFEPDYRAVNMKEVVNIIKKHNRMAKDMEIQQGQQTQTAKTIESIMPLRTAEKVESEFETSTGEEQNKTDKLLAEILDQLRRNQRTEMFGEFRVTRMVAGIIQIVVLFCMLISAWLLMSPTRSTDSVLISLGFAAVLQVMSLTFFIMQRHK